MIHLKNDVKVPHHERRENGDLEILFGGVPYLFPAGKVVAVDDDHAARWFQSRMALHPSPKHGRETSLFPLVQVQLQEGEEPVLAHRIKAETPPVDPVILERQAKYQQHGKPRKEASPPGPKGNDLVLLEKKAISDVHPDVLAREAKARNVYRKSLEKTALVDRLHSSGYRAPRAG